ncbi:hypothetical protein EJ08DRAFT_646907 [Tothia fuscella]|uniref:Uncharacterized protein n=1 Tax=Tothia fuscella TaxID=1048955 RepID=A0A9P4NZC4_9PEZI|nr:hypothetical protein EJ08DRAFT_646907 [Tothia fuscella]
MIVGTVFGASLVVVALFLIGMKNRRKAKVEKEDKALRAEENRLAMQRMMAESEVAELPTSSTTPELITRANTAELPT